MIKITTIFLLCLVCFGAQSQNISTCAGNGVQGYSGDGGPASSAELNQPSNMVFDRFNNLYICDQFNNVIRKVDSVTGIISTVAGNGVTGYSGDGGPALMAEMNLPSSLCVDDTGNIFISDFYNNCIREVVNATGKIYTVAGTGVAGYSGDNGPATAAKLDMPHQPTLDFHGNLFIADENNNRIRKVNLASGIIITVAGNGATGFSGDGGPATAAELHSPKCVAVDDSGNMYIADWLNNRIRKVSALTGIITTLAGNGNPGYSGDGGPAIMADVNDPYRVILDKSENVFIATGSDNRIRMVNTLTDTINTLAGRGAQGFSGDGGPAIAAELHLPSGVTTGRNGNIFIADFANNRIRRVTALSASAAVANISCNGENNGSLSAQVTGITPPFTYLWAPGGETTSAINGLSAGTYTLNLTDNIGDTGSATFLITEPAVLMTNVTTTKNVKCFGGNNGSASVIASGGTSPYTYLWSDASSQTKASATGLIMGTYTITIMDKHGCPDSATIVITQPLPIAATTDSIGDNGTCNGSAWAIVSGGVSPYSYLWTYGSTTDTIYNQCFGTYCCMITDANSCHYSLCTSIQYTAGISALKAKNGAFLVYPNPNNGIFYIALNLADSGSQTILEIYNVLQEKVYSTGYQLSANNYQPIPINLSDKPSGVYFYRIINNAGSLLGDGKIVIAH